MGLPKSNLKAEAYPRDYLTRNLRQVIGRGDKIRTCDPLHPMQVRYQAAPRPDRMRIIAEKGQENLSAARPARAPAPGGPCLAPQYLYELFELQTHLMNQLLALVEVNLRIVAGEAVACPANRESLFIQ